MVDLKDKLYIILILVYDVLTGKIVDSLEGHKACVRDVSWHPYEHKLISTSVSITSYYVILDT